MKYCIGCQQILGPKTLYKQSRCKECYRTYERERRRKIRKKKSEQNRKCPNCDIVHRSPGYCLEYCIDCFRKSETRRKYIWRQNNRDIDNARLTRYKKSPKGMETAKNWRREQYRRKKAILVKENGGCCQKCGYDRNIAALTFHHVDPESKSFAISRHRMSSLEMLRVEALKCILLCVRCHHEEHYPDLNDYLS